MSPESQQIAIAEACGWTNVRETSFNLLGCHPKADLSALSDEYLCARTVPDYPADLNACHEFEGKLIALGPPALDTYEIFLLAICTRAGNRIFRATAPQRAEAFLKTIGKWTNDN